jgi:membrane fusion protein
MSPPSALFRPEVMQAQSAAWLGTVQLGFTPPYRWIAAVALVLGGLFIAFAALGEANRKTRLTGLLVPTQGSINIAAPQAGVLLERRIAEGQAVQAGDVLLVLGTERQSMAGSAVVSTAIET